ncbi:hypothetical protein AMIS_34090 [Actinoplanes missouriensis 431]|uniref:Integral membrane protein n=1 Tax=Actinoplanes missouriensis (strain ATCC 14538 / DSM 43046 / CBS 188.64 / JCM 3121 / NBRC 102363 / NCIMB 12654 / NRRL B-3342 / UNCC 431) TaxID=512565 RepID=I0H6J2_ACTM4|nr:hypothetical protein [Actinoplanes missouriensis]BAL88629.1 hypothetical protein AMIS_34090 [Actinoplanes missouriensis 431]
MSDRTAALLVILGAAGFILFGVSVMDMSWSKATFIIGVPAAASLSALYLKSRQSR